MTKLLLLLSTTLVPTQVAPLLVSSVQNPKLINIKAEENTVPNPQKLEIMEMEVSQKIFTDSQFAASIYDLFIHNGVTNLEQHSIHSAIQKITGDEAGVNLGGKEEEIEEWLNQQINQTESFKIETFETKYLKDETYKDDFVRAIGHSINLLKQPVILQSENDSCLVLGFNSETKDFYVSDSDDSSNNKKWLSGDELLEKLQSGESDTQIFVIAKESTLNILNWKAWDISVVKQELSYYHLPAAIKSLTAAYNLDYASNEQNDLYSELRKVTKTPDNKEGVIIKDQEVSDYINQLTWAKFGTFNLGQGFGIMRDEVAAFNKSIDESLKKGHPLILTNQSHSFVISGITINENNPWLSTVTGMNPEKGKIVEVSCQRLTWFNRENTYLIGEKEAISQNINVASSEVPIDQKIVKMNNLEDGLNIKAFDLEINLTAITSLQSIPKIKENLSAFVLPGFSAQIFKIDGTVEEKQGLTIETAQLPDTAVEHWQGDIKKVLEFVDKTTNEKIRTWVSYRLVINQDFLGDLNLTIQVLVGSEISSNAERLTGKVNLDSGKIFKLNR